jgi:putative ABC transport system permease protein
VTAIAIKSGINPFLAIVASMCCGAVAGFLTGILNVRYKIADLLSGIIVAYMLYSVNLMVMGNAPNITFVEQDTIFTIFKTSAIVVVILLASITYMMFSNFGLRLRAVGYNRQFSRTHGINVNQMTFFGLAVSNALIAAGGSLFSQYQGFCDISCGFGALITSLAAIVVGTKVLPFRSCEPLLMVSCVVGSILYRVFINIALHSDVFHITTQNLNLVTGIIIIAIMAMKRRRV